MIEEIHKAGIEHLKKVVGLRNRPAPECNGAEPSVIEAIEELLARARRGEIVAIAATVVPESRKTTSPVEIIAAAAAPMRTFSSRCSRALPA